MAQQARRVVSPVVDAQRMQIAHSTHPLARPEFDIGAVDASQPMERMLMVLSMSAEQQQALTTLLDNQQTQGSPDYHRWLTPEEFGQRFGAHPADIQAVTGWLQGQGFRVENVAQNGLVIEFSGTAQQVNQAFRTQMHRYQVRGETHIANASDISIPAALAGVVKGVSLQGFFSKPVLRQGNQVRRQADGTYTAVSPDARLVNGSGTVFNALAPGDFAKIYDLNPLYSSALQGTNETIAIVATSDMQLQDASDFHAIFLNGTTYTQPNIIHNGPDVPFDPNNGDAVEATLDVEWAGALAPSATIDEVVSATTATTDGVDLSALYIVDNDLAPIMSTSFGLCEALFSSNENTFWNNLWQQAAAQGISAFVSSGDNGAAGCDNPNDPSNGVATGGVAVSGLASTPYDTAVGGTQFNDTSSPSTYWGANGINFVSVVGYIPEMVWNESCDPTALNSPCASQGDLYAGSGGLSSLYTQPTWQHAVAPSFTMRAIPDVSLAAAIHDGYLICFNGSCNNTSNPYMYLIGGTSASTPSFAAIMALVDEKMGGPQGLANYVLYRLAANESFSACNSSSRTNPYIAPTTACVFNDITSGNNGVPGNDVTNNPTAGALGYPAATGYDLASGLGSVDAYNLVTSWSNATFLPSQTALTASYQGTTLPSATVNITHGQAVAINVTVSRQGSSGTPSGNVSLIAKGGNLSGTVGIKALPLSGTSGTASTGTVNVSDLPGGTAYSLLANYPGDGTFSSSQSLPITLTVNPENSTTTLTAYNINANPITTQPITVGYGNFLALHALVAGSSGQGYPSGTVNFNDNSMGVGMGAVVLNSAGQAELFNCSTQPACPDLGTHNISAIYGGNNSFNSSTSSTIALNVVQGSPNLGMNVPANVAYNTPAAITAVITGGFIAATGNVQFLDGGTLIGSPVSLAGSPAQATLNFTLTSGTHNLSYQYSGDSHYLGGTSSPTAVIVAQPFSFSVAIPSQTVNPGSIASYGVVLTGSNFSGTVTLTCTSNNAPAGVTCHVPPSASISNPGNPVVLQVSISTSTQSRLMPSPFNGLPFAFAGVFAAVLCRRRKAAVRSLLTLAFAAFAITGITACGSHPPPAADATFVVTGTSGSFTNSTSLSLHINP